MGNALSDAIVSRYNAFRREYRKTLQLEHHMHKLEKPRSLFRRLGRVCGMISRNLSQGSRMIEPARRSHCYSCETEFTFFRRGDNCGTCNTTHCRNCSRSRGFFKPPTCHTCIEMKEHGFDRFFQDKFEHVKKFSPRDVQPIEQNDASTFRGGRYHMMIAKTIVPIHRIVDQNSNRSGAFWTLTPPANVDGTMLSERIGLAILPEWNRMEDATYAILPPGFIVYGGFAAPQSNKQFSLLGGALQIFVPRNVADVLFTGQGNMVNLLARALELQEINYNNYVKKVIDDWNRRVEKSASFLVLDGNRSRELPEKVREALGEHDWRGGERRCTSYRRIPQGSWIVHEEKDEVLGCVIEIEIKVTLDRVVTETTQQSKTTIYYYIIYITIRRRE